MKIKKGYKVVYVRKERYFSAYVEGLARVEYFFDQFVEPPGWLKEKGFGLHCFSNKKLAIKYMKEQRSDYFILTVIEYEPFGENESNFFFASFIGLVDGKILPIPHINILPLGTVFASKIKLLKRVPVVGEIK